MSVPISAMMAAAAVTSIPGIEQSRFNASLCFRISPVIASSTAFLWASSDSRCPKIIARKLRWWIDKFPFRAIRIWSIRFLVCVFRHLSSAAVSMLPFWIKFRMILRPDAPKASERNAVKRNPELCRNLSIRFFWAVISCTMLLR